MSLFYLWVRPKGTEVDLPSRNSPGGVDLEPDTVQKGENKVRGRTVLLGPLRSGPQEHSTLAVRVLKIHTSLYAAASI